MNTLSRAIAFGLVGTFTLIVGAIGFILLPIYVVGRVHHWWRRASSRRKAVR